jgi:predicted glycosyl hydrolase (DUF1957 family)
MKDKITLLEENNTVPKNANVTKTISFIKASIAQLNDELIQYKIQQVKDKLKNIIQEENKVENSQNESIGNDAQSQIKILHLEKHQEILEKRNIMLNQLLTQGAKERCIIIYNN